MPKDGIIKRHRKAFVLMSTSKLQKQATKLFLQEFGSYGFRENSRPDWLTSDKGERLELDIFLSHLCVAIEIQGEQHFGFVEHFHGDYDSFLSQQARDEAKRVICASKDITLYEVTNETELNDLINILRESVKSIPQPKDPKWWMKQQGLYVKSATTKKRKRLSKHISYLKQLSCAVALSIETGEQVKVKGKTATDFRLRRAGVNLEHFKAKLRRATLRAWEDAARLPMSRIAVR